MCVCVFSFSVAQPLSSKHTTHQEQASFKSERDPMSVRRRIGNYWQGTIFPVGGILRSTCRYAEGSLCWTNGCKCSMKVGLGGWAGPVAIGHAPRLPEGE